MTVAAIGVLGIHRFFDWPSANALAKRQQLSCFGSVSDGIVKQSVFGRLNFGIRISEYFVGVRQPEVATLHRKLSSNTEAIIEALFGV